MGRWTNYNKGWYYWTEKQQYQFTISTYKFLLQVENREYKDLKKQEKEAMKQLKKERPRLTADINLRVTDEMLKVIKLEAERYEITPSEFIRRAITQYQTTTNDDKRGQ